MDSREWMDRESADRIGAAAERDQDDDEDN